MRFSKAAIAGLALLSQDNAWVEGFAIPRSRIPVTTLYSSPFSPFGGGASTSSGSSPFGSSPGGGGGGDGNPPPFGGGGGGAGNPPPFGGGGGDGNPPPFGGGGAGGEGNPPPFGSSSSGAGIGSSSGGFGSAPSSPFGGGPSSPFGGSSTGTSSFGSSSGSSAPFGTGGSTNNFGSNSYSDNFSSFNQGKDTGGPPMGAGSFSSAGETNGSFFGNSGLGNDNGFGAGMNNNNNGFGNNFGSGSGNQFSSFSNGGGNTFSDNDRSRGEIFDTYDNINSDSASFGRSSDMYSSNEGRGSLRPDNSMYQYGSRSAEDTSTWRRPPDMSRFGRSRDRFNDPDYKDGVDRQVFNGARRNDMDRNMSSRRSRSPPRRRDSSRGLSVAEQRYMQEEMDYAARNDFMDRDPYEPLGPPDRPRRRSGGPVQENFPPNRDFDSIDDWFPKKRQIEEERRRGRRDRDFDMDRRRDMEFDRRRGRDFDEDFDRDMEFSDRRMRQSRNGGGVRENFPPNKDFDSIDDWFPKKEQQQRRRRRRRMDREFADRRRERDLEYDRLREMDFADRNRDFGPSARSDFGPSPRSDSRDVPEDFAWNSNPPGPQGPPPMNENGPNGPPPPVNDDFQNRRDFNNRDFEDMGPNRDPRNEGENPIGRWLSSILPSENIMRPPYPNENEMYNDRDRAENDNQVRQLLRRLERDNVSLQDQVRRLVEESKEQRYSIASQKRMGEFLSRVDLTAVERRITSLEDAWEDFLDEQEEREEDQQELLTRTESRRREREQRLFELTEQKEEAMERKLESLERQQQDIEDRQNSFAEQKEEEMERKLQSLENTIDEFMEVTEEKLRVNAEQQMRKDVEMEMTLEEEEQQQQLEEDILEEELRLEREVAKARRLDRAIPTTGFRNDRRMNGSNRIGRSILNRGDINRKTARTRRLADELEYLRSRPAPRLSPGEDSFIKADLQSVDEPGLRRSVEYPETWRERRPYYSQPRRRSSLAGAVTPNLQMNQYGGKQAAYPETWRE